MTVPYFSIVSATYNSAGYISALLSSLKAQTFKDYEWIVVDGASNDSTVDLLKSADLPNLKYISEADRGIYDALNKGIDMASGSYLLFLGSDDCLVDAEVLKNVADLLNAQSTEPDIVLGRAYMEAPRAREFESVISAKTLILNSVHHQAAFYKKALFKDFRYDLNFSVVADYELNLLAYLKKMKLLQADLLISSCGAEGLSARTQEIDAYKDMHLIRKKHIGSLLSWVTYFIGRANIVRRRVLR